MQDITAISTDILRMKRMSTMLDDDQRFVIQGMYMPIEGYRQRPWKPSEKRESRLIFNSSKGLGSLLRRYNPNSSHGTATVRLSRKHLRTELEIQNGPERRVG